MNPYPNTEPRPLQPTVASAIKILTILASAVAGDGSIKIKLPTGLNVDWGNILGDIDNQTDLIEKIGEMIASAITALGSAQGDFSCAGDPNYPPAVKGDFWYVNVAGKIGGPAGKPMDVGDVFYCKEDSVGGTQAAVGHQFFDLPYNMPGLTTVGVALATLATPAEDSLAKIKPDGTVETVPFSSAGGGADLQEVWMATGI